MRKLIGPAVAAVMLTLVGWAVLDARQSRAAMEGMMATVLTREITGMQEHREEIDALLRKYSEHWALERMPAIDRALLRLGTYELIFREDIPRTVILDEAVKLAKSFGTDESPSFVNGVLDRIANDVGRKDEQKLYRYHSGFEGGLREERAKDLRQKNPVRMVEEAVRGMLPKTKLGEAMWRKLKVYAGADHPHAAQKPRSRNTHKQEVA